MSATSDGKEPNDKATPGQLDFWLILAAVILCLSLLIRSGVEADKLFRSGPVASAVSR